MTATTAPSSKASREADREARRLTIAQALLTKHEAVAATWIPCPEPGCRSFPFETAADLAEHLASGTHALGFATTATVASFDTPTALPTGTGGSARPASNERTNRYPGLCSLCGVLVPAETGLLVRVNGAWAAQHRPGACPAKVEATPVAPTGRTNRFATACADCGQTVAEGTGSLTKESGAWTVRHVGGCPATAPTVAATAPAPSDLPDIPAGHYAVTSHGDNDLLFVRVDRPTTGSYAGATFVKMIVGGHPDQNVARKNVPSILARIAEAGIVEAGALYGQEIGRCCRCNRHLTDETSRAAGIGPECARRS